MASLEPTDDLLERLRKSDSFASFDEEYSPVTVSLSDYLGQLLLEKGIAKADVIRKSRLNETFGYQIFAGTRNPSRDKVLQLAFGIDASFEETQHLLKYAGHNELYVKDRRDAIVIFCIDHSYELDQADDELFKCGERTILDPQC